jgi:tetratricopeptide (TPR) repeat protein
LSLQLCFAHGDLDIRINSATLEIEQFPDSAILYLNRGELHYQHEEYLLALTDFKETYDLGFIDTRIHLGMAKSLLKLKQYEESISYVNQIIKTSPNHVVALRLKGDILFEMEAYGSAAEYYELVIQHADKTFTENYLEAANAWANTDLPNKLELSIKILQKGIDDLGPLLVFYQAISELYEQHLNFEQAIVYQTKIIEISNRKEFSYVKRAELYRANRNYSAALEDLKAAKAAIQQLPISKQNNSAILSLIEEVNKFELILNPQNN